MPLVTEYRLAHGGRRCHYRKIGSLLEECRVKEAIQWVDRKATKRGN